MSTSMMTAAYARSHSTYTDTRSSLSSQDTTATHSTGSRRRIPRSSPVIFADDSDSDAGVYTSASANASSTSLGRTLYTKVIRRAWKHVTRKARGPERASRLLPDGFVIIANNRRRSILFV